MDWSKFLRLPGPTALAGFIASVGLSWGYSHNIGLLRKLEPKYVVFANVGAFVFGAIALVWILDLFRRLIWFLMLMRGERNSMRGYLDSLDADEHDLLYRMRANNQRSISMTLIDPVATKLKETKRLLMPASGTGSMFAWLPWRSPRECGTNWGGG